MSPATPELLDNAKAWPFAEARALIERLGGMKADPGPDRPVLFETGYGPSGLPHIGTFGEVVRTSMVRHAYEALTGHPTRLVCFSDDMDGLRKVPDNIPNRETMEPHLGKPLTEVPDPFGTHDSFGAHNNARLQAFLDGFGFDYEFLSSTECYRSGRFDGALMRVLECYDEVTGVILPTLGEKRRATYSPFLPVCPETREVLQVEITGRDAKAGTVEYNDPRDGKPRSVPVTGGGCKLQWKCDWAMRWYALGVDYEMSGKDLIESVELSSEIVRIMGGTPPVGISYEMFLDEHGQKISKSKGNGLSVEEWLAYGTEESLALFMYNQPKRAKRLFFDVIPKMVDEYQSHLEKYQDAEEAARVDSPAWHIHGGEPPAPGVAVGFTLLLNLAGVCQAETPDVLWGYLQKYSPDVSPKENPQLAKLVGKAVAYYQDIVLPSKEWRRPRGVELHALMALDQALALYALDKKLALLAVYTALELVKSDYPYALMDVKFANIILKEYVNYSSLEFKKRKALLEFLHAILQLGFRNQIQIEDFEYVTPKYSLRKELPEMLNISENLREDEIDNLRSLIDLMLGEKVNIHEKNNDSVADDIQSLIFAVGKYAGYENLRDWFSCLYQVLLGQKEGPRMGSFINLYGIEATRELVRQALSGVLVKDRAK